MEILWFIILGVLFGMFLLFEGYEWGARTVYFLYAGTGEERRQVLDSVRSIWAANEVWLLAYLGLMYVVFPDFFAWNKTHFEGIFYTYVVLYVLSVAVNNLIPVFFDRPVRKVLDIVFFAAQLGMIFLTGIYIAVVIRGWNGDHTALWSKNFSPFTEQSGYLDWFTLLFSFFFFIIILLQGLGWVVHKVRAAFGRKLKFKIQKWAIYGAATSIVLIASLYFILSRPFQYYLSYPVWFLLPVMMISSFAALMAIRTYAKDNKGFMLATNLFIYFWLGVMVLQYPYLVHATNHSAGIDVFHTTFRSLQQYHLQWWVIATGVTLLIYSILIHKYSKGRSLHKD